MDATSILNTSSILDPKGVVEKLNCSVHPWDPVCVVQKVFIGITLLFALIGIMANSLLIKKYLKTRDLNILFPCLIVYLAFSDILYLIFTTVSEVNILAGLSFRTHLTYFMLTACLQRFAFAGSMFTTIALAIDRYLVLCRRVYVF